jgi:putative hemolysin
MDPRVVLEAPVAPNAERRPPAPCAPPLEPALEVRWARDAREVRAAQRLRYRVFAEEMGARLVLPRGAPAGHDIDRFDAHCEHLVVRLRRTGAAPGEVIGTYRVLTPDAARRAGGLYTQTEFDLSGVRHLLPHTLELGRSCVHPDHRSGAAVLALWGAIVAFAHRNGLRTLLGCASVPMRDGGHAAASLWAGLARTHAVPTDLEVVPRVPLPVDSLRQDLPAELPPLVKGYLRCGARLAGRPAWDPDFGCADLPMLLHLDDLPVRYRRHFLGF